MTTFHPADHNGHADQPDSRPDHRPDNDPGADPDNDLGADLGDDLGHDPGIGVPVPDEDFERRRDQVVAALDRLARGEFARCSICGAQVDDRRLQIAPDADRCQRHITTPAAGAAAGEGRPR